MVTKQEQSARRQARRDHDEKMGRAAPPILAKRTDTPGTSSGALRSSAGMLDGSPACPVDKRTAMTVSRCRETRAARS